MSAKRKRGITFRQILSLVGILFLAVVLNFSLKLVQQKNSVLPRVPAASNCQRVILPAYSYPSPRTFWDQAMAAYPTLGMMIVDPANGPGSFVDSNYVAVIADARAKGIKLLGYVDSGYAGRSPAVIKTDVDLWKSMYGITDIFIDQVTSGAENLSYYSDIVTYIKTGTTGALASVVLNPGTIPDEGYIKMADVVSVFEGEKATYDSFQFPSWVNNYPSSKFLHLIYNVSDSRSMDNVLALSRQRNAGYVYVTSDILPNPWDVLPSYWGEEVGNLNLSCSASTPTPAPSTSPGEDTTPPSVSITSPSNGSVIIRNSQQIIIASASDNVGVKKVEFSFNGTRRCTDTSSPYTCSWKTPGKSNTTYSVQAKAYDAAGNSAIATIILQVLSR